MSREGKQNPSRALLTSLVGVVCLAYFLTSAVVLVNAFAWLPSMPSAWYQMQRVLYWPFKPYFSLASALLGGSSIPYTVYAVVAWSPFLVVSMAAALCLWFRRRGSKSRKPGRNPIKEGLQPQ